MKNIKSPLLSLIALATLTHCGDGGRMIPTSQDPLAEYKIAKEAVTPFERESIVRSEFPETYNIIKKGDLNFTQGESTSVDFEVQILSDFANETKFELKADKNILDLGATFKKKDSNTWTLSWKPSDRLLGSNEDSKRIVLELDLAILSSSSARAKKIFDKTYTTAHYEAVVRKNESVPQFVGAPRLSTGQIISLGQRTEIQFTVTAGNISSADDIEIQLNPENQKASREILQASAAAAIVEGPEKVQSQIYQGQLTSKYKMTFDSTTFWEKLQAAVNSDAVMKRNYLRGDYTRVEARLVIVAKNKLKNFSESKEVFLVVDLDFQPGTSEISSGTDALEVNSSQKKVESFTLKSNNGQGDLTVLGATVNGVEMNHESGTYSFTDAAQTLKLTCKNMTGTAAQKICQVGACAQTCKLDVQVGCSNEDKIINISIKTLNEIAEKSKESQVTRQIKVKKADAICGGAQS